MTDGLGWSWLAATVRAPLDDVRGLLGRHVGQVVELGYGFKWYEQAASVGTNGSTLAWAPRGFEGRDVPEWRRDEASVIVTQSECERLGWSGCVALVRELQALGASFTRADCRWDNAARTVEPAGVLAAFHAGQVVSHVRQTGLDRTQRRGGAPVETAYLGSRSSPSILRVYDADAVHGGGGVRWELETHGERAQHLVETVLLAEGHQGEAFAAVLVHLVDFRDRVAEAHGRRSPRLGWWAAIVGQVQAARIQAAQLVDSLDRRKQWVRRQVLPTLALLVASEGGDLGWLEQGVRDALGRVSSRAWLLVEPELRPGWAT